jgi:uncharacterized glyoxalase superfamily protein PhnB
MCLILSEEGRRVDYPGGKGRGGESDQDSRSTGGCAATNFKGMTHLASVTLEVADTAAADRFYATAFGLGTQIRLRASEAPSTGFRGFALGLTVPQPVDVDSLLATAVDAGATALKPASKSLWGYGGVVRAPDGAIWKIATSEKKNTGPATRRIDDIVLLLGVADVAETKRFYMAQGLAVGKSFGSRYVEFEAGQFEAGQSEAGQSAVKLALYRHRALAKEVGVTPEGTGSHRIVLGGTAGAFTDPDGFAWEAAAPATVG